VETALIFKVSALSLPSTVSRPSPSMVVPAAGAPPSAFLTVQVTVCAGLPVPSTTALNCWVLPLATVTVPGLTVTPVRPVVLPPVPVPPPSTGQAVIKKAVIMTAIKRKLLNR
jgi:hypothetical protein